MSVETVNGHILLPHPANWDRQPTVSRQWETEVSDAEFGNESRFGLRSVPRKILEWSITATDLQEQSQLMDRILAAMKSGLACAPHWGRASELAEMVTDDQVEIETSLWPWVEDDYLILIDDDGAFEVGQIASIAGNILTLTAAVDDPHRGPYVWPLIFGTFRIDNYGLLTSRIGAANLSISELTSPDAVTIGTASPEIDGIGGWIIGDTFIVQ